MFTPWAQSVMTAWGNGAGMPGSRARGAVLCPRNLQGVKRLIPEDPGLEAGVLEGLKGQAQGLDVACWAPLPAPAFLRF